MYSESFLPNKGYKFSDGHKSILIHSISNGRPLNKLQKEVLNNSILQFMDGIENRNSQENAEQNASFLYQAHGRRNDFFKFANPFAMAKMKEGLFRFGSLMYYQTIEDKGRLDIREGCTTLFLEGNKKSFQFTATSGFNHGVFCGTSKIPSSADKITRMKAQFGECIVKINLEKFLKAIKPHFPKADIYSKNMVYLKNKLATIKSQKLDLLVDNLGDCLSKEALHQLNTNYFTSFYNKLIFPSTFNKPINFAHEEEKRILILLPNDITEPYLEINAPDAVDALEFL